MAKPPLSNKRDNEKKKASKRLEKQQKKESRKSNSGTSLEDMFVYVDENGMLTDVPPQAKKEEIDINDILISTPKKEEVEKESVYKGRVEHFNASKGYGFIKDMSSVEKYFFHISSAPENISEGNVVLFELARGTKGLNAVNIRYE